MRRSGLGGWAGWPAVAMLAMIAGPARGQFVVERQARPVPLPPAARSYEVGAVSVDARVRDGVAEVRVSQTFHNPGSTVIEAEYLFPLPDEAAVGDLTLMVDGKELPGRVLPKADARRIYEEIVRTRRDPALLEYMGRGLFRASVFPIPPGADRVVTLRYTQVCRRERDVVEFAFPLADQKQAGRPIGKLDLLVRVEGRDEIKSVYCPGHPAAITRGGEREATAKLEGRNVIPTSDFRLVYTLGDGALGASLVSYRPSEGEDGYFLLLASPRVKPVEEKARPKTVVFVLDRSGSMAGKKIDQAKGALQFVLDNLRDDDTFDIVAYDDHVEAFRPELQRYSKATREEATRFVANIRPGGGTNLNGGLEAALALIPDDSRPGYVIFLTDGLASTGERAELKIAANARAANKAKARVFSFGVGFDVNARLLDRLSGGSGGTSEYVRPDEDIEAHVAAFYGKLTRPALTGIRVELAGLDVNRTYPRDIPDLFEGGQLAWVGRYPKSGPTTIRLAGKVGGERQAFEFPAELAGAGSATGRDFVEKLWAVRRVGFIIDQIDLDGPNPELTDELVALSTRYGLLTPYTSFLADERVPLHARVENGRQARMQLEALQITQGQAGTMQRAGKQVYSQANSLQEVDAAMMIAAAPAGRGMGGMGGGISGGGFAGAGGGIGGAGNFGGGDATKPDEVKASSYLVNPFIDHSVSKRTPVSNGKELGAKRNFTSNLGIPLTQGSASQISPFNGIQTGQGQGRGAGQAPGQPGAADPAANVRRVGTKTFYRKAGRWVDAEVKPEDDGKAIAVEQFGAAYFQLAAAQSAEQNQYLALDEPVTVRIADKIYRIDPPKVQ